MITLLLTRWKLILPIILIAAMSLYATYYKTRYERAVQALATLKDDIAKATAQQVADNAIKHINAQNKVDTAEAQAIFNMTRFNLDRTQSTKEMKVMYENKISSIKRGMDHRTDIMLPRSGDTVGTVETASDTEGITESERKCNATIDTLEKACTITTLDYNLAREWIDSACEIMICE